MGILDKQITQQERKPDPKGFRKRNSTVLLLEKRKIDKIQFLENLDTKLSSHGNIPLRFKRIIKILRLILRRPVVAYIDQNALDIEDFTSLELFLKLKKFMPETTFVIILSNYKDICNFKKVYVLKSGKILESGDPKELLKHRDSELYSIIKRNDKDTLSEVLRAANIHGDDGASISRWSEGYEDISSERIDVKLMEGIDSVNLKDRL